jgi:hypothetical protein
MDADEVPEGGGALGLTEEHPDPDLRRVIRVYASNGLIARGTQGPQADRGRFIVEGPYEPQHERPSHEAGEPERPLQAP